jgi:hypothetical protein
MLQYCLETARATAPGVCGRATSALSLHSRAGRCCKKLGNASEITTLDGHTFTSILQWTKCRYIELSSPTKFTFVSNLLLTI